VKTYVLGIVLFFTIILIPIFAFPQAGSAPDFRAFFENGISEVESDVYYFMTPGLDAQLRVPTIGCGQDECRSDLRFRLQVPFRLRLSESNAQSLLREEDWNEPSDYARVLPRFQFGNKNEALFVQLGELSPVDIGHASIVSEYSNAFSLNTFRPGALAILNTEFGGFELLIDNVFSPDLVAGRVFLRPFGNAKSANYFARLSSSFELGLTLAMDYHAPLRLHALEKKVDVYGQIRVEEEGIKTIGGIDAEFTIFSNEGVELIPFADLNVSKKSLALHYGVDLNVFANEIRFWLRGEGRLFEKNYIPNYFGTTYDIDRYQFSGWGQPFATPKSRASFDTELGKGIRILAGLSLDPTLAFSIEYAIHNIGHSGNLVLKMDWQPLQNLFLGLFFLRPNFETFEEIFKANKSVIVSEIRYDFYGPFYAFASYEQKFSLQENGLYSATRDGALGLGVQVLFGN